MEKLSSMKPVPHAIKDGDCRSKAFCPLQADTEAVRVLLSPHLQPVCSRAVAGSLPVSLPPLALPWPLRCSAVRCQGRPLWPSPLQSVKQGHSISAPPPRPLVGSQQPALLEPVWGPVLTRGTPRRKAVSWPCSDLFPIRVAVTQLGCLQSSAVPRPPPQRGPP